jgi:magnesium transporter
MISIYKNTESGLTTLTEPVSGCWINAINPTTEEIQWLQSLQIPSDYITYPLDLDERSRTERENGELLIVLRIPYYQGQATDVPYITIPLGIIINENYLITICKRENSTISEFASGRIRGLSTAKRNRFVLRLLLHTASNYLAHLREINKVVDGLEDQLQLSTRNKEVLDLLKYQKSLTYFTTALKSNELMMERLQRSQLFKAFPEDEDLLEDVITENQQAIEMTNISSNILSSMMDAFASIISNNLNGVMKFLAAVTIVISIPTMVTSTFGMNVDLPFASSPLGFWVVMAIAVALTLAFAYVFARRDWF